MKKILDVDSQEFLDESVSNFTFKDLFAKDVVATGLLTGNPAAALEKARQNEEKAKRALQIANQVSKDVLQVKLNEAQNLVAQAEAQLEASKNNSTSPSALKESDVKAFPWKTVGFVAGGLAAATGLFFLVRHFVKKK